MNRASWEAYLTEHLDMLYGLARSRCVQEGLPPHVAEDLVHWAIPRAMAAPLRQTGAAVATAWLKTALTRRARDLARGYDQRFTDRYADPVWIEGRLDVSGAMDLDARRSLARLLAAEHLHEHLGEPDATLVRRQLAAWFRSRMEGWTAAEIAEKTGQTRPGVARDIMHAEAVLQGFIGTLAGDPGTPSPGLERSWARGCRAAEALKRLEEP